MTMAMHTDFETSAKDNRRAKSSRNLTKRVLDLSLTSFGILAIAPLLIGTSLAIKLTSRGPVFFRQERIGKDGKPFMMYKFRRAALLETSDRKGVCFKQKDDPRITRVGRFIRRFSIDELPQLLNVIKGYMSLVGPRPALPEEVAVYSPRALERLKATPGLTGVWQVSGRADIGFDRMVEMDIAYSRSVSLMLDLMLLALTFRAVLSGRGAY